MRHHKLPKITSLSLAFIFLPFTQPLATPADGDAFGNWRVRCETDAEDNRQACFIVQNLVLREGGQPVLRFAIGFVEETPEPIASLILPLGISLPPGAKIQIDENDPTRVAIERCEPNGCRAGMKLGEEILDSLLQGEQISVTFYDAKREAIKVPLSLEGLEEGLAALRAPNP